MAAGYRINRIRLEFKVISANSLSMPCLGLIESDWNLKQAEYHDMTPRQMLGINRIRLEFKVSSACLPDCICLGLIESDWNLKL